MRSRRDCTLFFGTGFDTGRKRLEEVVVDLRERYLVEVEGGLGLVWEERELKVCKEVFCLG
jgi:hypothetical protein